LVSPGEAQLLQVTPREREKLQYLRNIIAGIHAFQEDFKEYRTEILLSSSTELDRKINWTGISNFLAPDVVLVTATSPDNNKGKFQGVWEYPIYAITASGIMVDLKRPFEIQVTESRHKAKADAVSTLKSLRGIISTYDNRKKANAMGLLERLERVMIPKN